MDSSFDEDLSYALKVAVQFLPEDRQATPQDVTTAISTAVAVAGLRGVTIDAAVLTKIVEARTNIFQEDSSALQNDEGHAPWLADAKNDRTWAFWQRYERFLMYLRNLPLQVVRGIDRSTDEVLGELEDPQRSGPWRRTGLVIGQVQSGKTGQFIGLATKAADAGYRLIVVFAGVHNDLRAQTQLRIDEGFLGFDTQYQLRSDEQGTNRYIGVGAMSGSERLPVASLTNSAEKGDFDRKTASKANLPIGNFPVVLVVKKHPKIINYLRTWVTEVHGVEDPETGRKIVRDVPLFVIDDEADNASINTADPEANPTAINAAIRELVQSFDKASYVGYTATPFANIYIDPDADHDLLGSDLFPDSFIRTLRAPSNYLGAERLFGLRAYTEDEDDIEPLPLVRHVDDTAQWIPDKHKSSHVTSTDLPATLIKAIHSFVLTCAARRARGQTNVHNSMLVHVTRFTNVQGHVRDQVDDYVRLLQNSLRDRYGTASRDLLAELRQLWNEDFVSTTAYFPADEARRLTWEEVTTELISAVQKFQVKAINGAAKDALDYYENRHKGLSVIAVGGQKLSRGLTLEGLSVSYYLRFSKTYDTLLQMGRWFGYRPGYEDLCRLYTTPSLESAYEEITAATDELRCDIEEMAALGLTPRQFGLKVRTSSLGLSITAANKMRQGTKVRLSYSGELAESTIFPLSSGIPESNFKKLQEFVKQLQLFTTPQVDEQSGSLVWRGISPEEVATFFDTYQAAQESNRIRPTFIAGYIRQCARYGELGSWTVRLVGRRDSSATVGIAEHTLGLVTRAASKTGVQSETRHTIKRILSPRDESLDLDPDQQEEALARTRKAAEGKLKRNGEPRNPSVATGVPLRAQRRTDQPLLLLYLIQAPERADLKVPLVGFAASFPFSDHQDKTEYVVNDIWWTQDSERDDFDDEDKQ
ncbi:Z1 domain-containing protein [Streptomyces sp. NPDC059757]|uniref:Z1 domain-containing protein n=1 Tax=Streptomyces sp. NPDC059757 TaxID=3346935 RepID=UPI003658EF64